jgi:hypothetical protein
MATVDDCFGNSIDYSITTGEPREFVFSNEVMYSRDKNIEVDDWKELLVAFVRMNNLQDEGRLFGKHAFVYWMEEVGLLPKPKPKKLYVKPWWCAPKFRFKPHPFVR